MKMTNVNSVEKTKRQAQTGKIATGYMSFTAAMLEAYDPRPRDGAKWVDPNGVGLSWEVGIDAYLHDICSPWVGYLWSFTTGDFLVVEDFEDYNDYPPDEIFSTWIDGWEVPTNGSMAGHADPPFAGTTIVHGGGQSMPLYYENNFKYSVVHSIEFR